MSWTRVFAIISPPTLHSMKSTNALKKYTRAYATTTNDNNAQVKAALAMGTLWRGVKGRRHAAATRRRRDRSLRNVATLFVRLKAKRFSELMWAMALKCQLIYRRCRQASYERRCEHATRLIQRTYRGKVGTQEDESAIICLSVCLSVNFLWLHSCQRRDYSCINAFIH